jgi:hypothetical protein
MQLRVKLAVGVAVLGIAGVSTAAVAHDRAGFRTDLNGYEEVPAVSTGANGSFKAAINRNADEIAYTLTYDGQFNGTVQQSHIHLGQESVNGGISVFLCSNLGNGPAGTQACPQVPPGQSVTLTGTITPADVIGPAVQGIAAGEFAELVRAMRAGMTYANIHSSTQPGGEIRGQISDDDDRDRDH